MVSYVDLLHIVIQSSTLPLYLPKQSYSLFIDLLHTVHVHAINKTLTGDGKTEFYTLPHIVFTFSACLASPVQQNLTLHKISPPFSTFQESRNDSKNLEFAFGAF